jgi:hypothetical protein
VQPWARYCLRCQELDEQGLLVRDERDGDLDDDGPREESDGEDAVELDEDLDEEDEPVDGDGLLGG